MSEVNQGASTLPMTLDAGGTRRRGKGGPLREALIGDHRTDEEIAEEFGCCIRTVRNTAERFNVPSVKLFGKQYRDIKRFRAAIEATKTGTAPRGRGRPRKAARAAEHSAA